MNPTHVGSLPCERPLHLTDSRGWSACSRHVADVSPIEAMALEFDGPWCVTCLARLADEAAHTIQRPAPDHDREEPQPISRREALATTRLAETLADYLEENPPPPGSRIARHLEEWVASFRTLAVEMGLLEIDA